MARFAEKFLATGRTIDVVVTAAGVMAPPETRVGPGWELQWATNCLAIRTQKSTCGPRSPRPGGARVAAFSSAGHTMSDIHWDDIDLADYAPWQR